MLRISGTRARDALLALAGGLPPARRASLRTLRAPATGVPLDRALLLWFPGPATATGEDLAEIHAHGGRGTVRAIEKALAAMPGLHAAGPGEFTRRALMNGRIDLAQAEGLADLLAAETERQRRAAMTVAGGALSQAVDAWQHRLLEMSAQVEAMLDFADEDDVTAAELAVDAISDRKRALAEEWRRWLARPSSERLRDGIRVAIAGPPNAGKSTLINALTMRDAAIVSPIAGTTRDIVEVPLALDGVPFRFADTAGLRPRTDDAIEAIGMDRARDWIAASDILLWLGDAGDAPAHPCCLSIAAKSDLREGRAGPGLPLSARTGEGLADLHKWLVEAARTSLPGETDIALNGRHRAALEDARIAIEEEERDPIILAEQLRAARTAIDRITGRAGTEAMLDALFGGFCIGK